MQTNVLKGTLTTQRSVWQEVRRVTYKCQNSFMGRHKIIDNVPFIRRMKHYLRTVHNLVFLKNLEKYFFKDLCYLFDYISAQIQYLHLPG